MRLVLFDIDGTLVDCGGQAKPLFASALETVFGATGDVEGYDFSGKPDPRIVLDLATGAGVTPDRAWREVPRVRDLYLEALDRALDRERVRVLPGIAPLVARLAAREDCALGLLTGNWERGARIKLGRRDLDRFFAFGSYGDEQIDRLDLPPVAFARAEEATGRSFRPEETWIVGDSLLDVACARAHGIRCLAVATGRTRGEALAAAGADRVLASLESFDPDFFFAP